MPRARISLRNACPSFFPRPAPWWRGSTPTTLIHATWRSSPNSHGATSPTRKPPTAPSTSATRHTPSRAFSIAAKCFRREPTRLLHVICFSIDDTAARSAARIGRIRTPIAATSLHADDLHALPHPVRREVHAAAVPAPLHDLLDHLLPEDLELRDRA